MKNPSMMKKHFCLLVFGLLDVSAVLLCFLPLFAARTDGLIQPCSLLSPSGIRFWIKILFSSLSLLTALLGILTLALQNLKVRIWAKSKYIISLSLSTLTLILLILCLQPYAAVFTFLVTAVKAFFLIKRQ